MNLGELRTTLGRHGLRLSRDLGQNFLVDDEQARRLASLAGVRSSDTVIEVGTGLGTLTRALAERARHVVTLEVDSGLVRALTEDALLPANVSLVHADVLKLDLAELVAEQATPVRLVANLPYSVATPVLRRLLDLADRVEDWSVMLQREVARRLLAPTGSRDYGSLAVLHQLCVDAHCAMDLSPRCFFPVPKVASSFVRIVPRAEPLVRLGELAAVESVLRAAFRQRRKTLVNSLKGASVVQGLDREALEAALALVGIDPRARAESLDPSTLLALARHLTGGEVAT